MDTTSILQLPVGEDRGQFERRVDDLVNTGVPVMEARSVIARSFGFGSWELLTDFLEEMENENSPVFAFESAVDAAITGNLAVLGSLLQENPLLVRQRSKRVHHATLLHYVSANGIENYRQKTPGNIIAVAAMLLNAGAEFDATLSDGSRYRRPSRTDARKQRGSSP
jgi:hypothetical protein